MKCNMTNEDHVNNVVETLKARIADLEDRINVATDVLQSSVWEEIGDALTIKNVIALLKDEQ